MQLVAKRFSPKQILDVGAHEGTWSKTVALTFPRADFLLVEPQREMSAHLNAFCSSDANARWVEAGVGAECGTMTFHVSDTDYSGSSFLQSANSEQSHLTQRSVNVVTIDSLYPSGQSLPELVKLDVQGFELQALKGATRLFGRTELFILEVSLYRFADGWPIFSEVVSFMSQHGYELNDIVGSARRPSDSSLGQLDLAFALRGGTLMNNSDW